jgi:hypothetical protein
MTLSAIVGTNPYPAHSSTSFKLVILSPQPFINPKGSASSTTSYVIGDPTSSHPLDAKTAAHCLNKENNCELKVVPISGKRFIKLGGQLN